MEPDRLDYRSPDPVAMRSKEILDLMPTPELRARARQVLHRVESAHPRARLPLQPSATLKSLAQGGARRSIKNTNRAKRRTILEAKSSRYQSLMANKIDRRTRTSEEYYRLSEL